MVKRRQFQRPLGEKRYKKLFIIATEGTKTEPLYFSIFNNQYSVVRIYCLRGKSHSSPLHVLQRMKEYLQEESLQDSDEAWLIVDKDLWTDHQLTSLLEWGKEKENYGVAVSNPKFEYWLLLHFENGYEVANSRECSIRLKKFLPDYDKDFDKRKINRKMIEEAIERAMQRDNPSCKKWPQNTGTTVYRLIQRILNSPQV